MSNLRRLYVYQAIKNFSLWMPVWIVFLNVDRGLTLPEIFLIAGIGWVVQAVSEVPTGAVADAFGRKVTLAAGTTLLAAGMAALALAPGFAGVAIGYLAWAIGESFISGADTALLYESAKLAGREEEFPKISSNWIQIMLASQGASAILGGLVASLRLDLPMLLTAALATVGILVAFSLREPPTGSVRRPGYLATLGNAGRYLVGHRPVTALIAYISLVGGAAFFVPFVLFQPAVQSHTIAIGWFGVLFTGLRGSALLGSRYGVRLVARSGLSRWMVIVPFVLAALFIGVAVSPTWWAAYLSMLLLQATGASLQPNLLALLNRLLPTKVRATVLSAQSLLMTVFIAIMHPAVGGVTDLWGLSYAFVLLSALSLLPLIARYFVPVHLHEAPPADDSEDAEPRDPVAQRS